MTQPMPTGTGSPGTLPNGYRPAPQLPRPAVRQQGLSFLIQAPSKAGKSTIADSGPRPRLILDVEGAGRWTPSRKTYWEPNREPPPHPEQRLTAGYGQPSITQAWETCVVLVREPTVIAEAYRVLNSGRHPFSSLSIDSMTETQQRYIDDRAGTKKIERDDWGFLLRVITAMCRQFRDLVTHPVRPLWSVSFITGTHLDQGKWRPMLQGQAKDYLPYYVDIIGYLNANPDGSRDLLIGPHPTYETGERVGNRLPYYMRIAYPGRFDGWTIESMLQKVLSD